MSAVEQLKSVLCGPDGKCCIAGSDEDRAIIDRALRALAQPAVEPVQTLIAKLQADPDYAWSWHCNIAMAYVDAGGDPYTGNQGAARFMKMFANVDPAHELPEPQPQLAVEPFGHVTVRRLSERFENHADQYKFYPAGQVPYLDNADECVTVFTAPPPPADVPLLTGDEIQDAIRHLYQSEKALLMSIAISIDEFRAIEQVVRQKAGLK